MPKTQPPHSEHGIIGTRGASPHHYRIVARTHQMHTPTGLRAGNPLALPGCRGNPPIQAGGQLQCQPGPALLYPQQKSRVGRPRRIGHDTGFHNHLGGPQAGKPLPAHTRIRIFQRGHHTRNPGRHQCIGAGRCLAMMGARLEGNIRRCTLCMQAGLRQGNGFCMWAPPRPGVATPNNLPFPDNHATNGRVGPDLPQCAGPKAQCKAHEPPVSRGGSRTHRSSASSICGGRSSDTNLSKSSAA